MDFEKFKRIRPRECLNQGWSKKTPKVPRATAVADKSDSSGVHAVHTPHESSTTVSVIADGPVSTRATDPSTVSEAPAPPSLASDASILNAHSESTTQRAESDATVGASLSPDMVQLQVVSSSGAGIAADSLANPGEVALTERLATEAAVLDAVAPAPSAPDEAHPDPGDVRYLLAPNIMYMIDQFEKVSGYGLSCIHRV